MVHLKATVKNWLEGWSRTSGKALPRPKYKSYGFLVQELSPVKYEKPSKEAVAKEAKEMQAYAGMPNGREKPSINILYYQWIINLCIF